MAKIDLAEKLQQSAALLVDVAEQLVHEANKNVESNPRQITLIIPLGMFAGAAIESLGLEQPPHIVYVGDSRYGDKRLGGVDYSSVRMTLREPFTVDPVQWEDVGSNTFVWRD